jgi:hypothetical protein
MLIDPPVMATPGVCELGKPAKAYVHGAGALAGFTVNAETEYAAVCGVEALSFTDTVNEKAPGVVGLPEMTPLVAFKVNPPGSAPELIK